MSAWNKATIDALNTKLAALGVAPVQPTRGWNRTVLDLLGALVEAGSGVDLGPPHVGTPWNSEFLYRLSAMLDAMGGGILKTVSPLDMASIDVLGLIKTQTYDANTGVWTITTNAGGANETSAKALTSIDPTTAAAFWLLPILDFDAGDRLSGLDIGLDFLNDPGVPSNLRVAAGFAAAPDTATVGIGYNFATGQSVLDAQGSLTPQTRTIANTNRIRFPVNFTHAGSFAHYWSRPAAYYFPADMSSAPTTLVTGGAHNITIAPNYLVLSLRPVGAVPDNTQVQVRLKYATQKRPEDWKYVP